MVGGGAEVLGVSVCGEEKVIQGCEEEFRHVDGYSKVGRL